MASCSAAASNVTVTLTVTESSTNVANNTSSVHMSLNASDKYGESWSGTPVTGTVTLDGTGHGYSYAWNSAGTQSRNLLAADQTVTHGSNGAITIGFSFTFSGIPGTSIPSASASGSIALTTIPRASSFTSVPTLTAGSNWEVEWKDVSSSFNYDIAITDTGGNYHALVSNASGGAYIWPAANNQSTLSSWIAGSSATLTVRVITQSGSTTIGTATHAVTVHIPDSGVWLPTAGTPVASEATTSPDVASLVGAYVQNVSKLNLSASGTSAGLGAALDHAFYTTSATSTTRYGSTTAANVPLPSSGTDTITYTYVNDRGFADTATSSVSVLAYGAPRLLGMSVVRADASGIEDDGNGEYFLVSLNASVTSLVNGTQRNDLKYKIDVSPSGANTWTNVASQDVGALTFNSTVLVGGGTYDIRHAWDVRVTVSDIFSSTTTINTVPTATIFMHWDSSNGMGIGKYRENGMLDVAGSIFANGVQVDPSGWANLASYATPTTGWSLTQTPSGYHAPAIRRMGNMVFINALVYNTSGGTMGQSTLFTITEPTLCPTWDQQWAGTNSARQAGMVFFTASGAVAWYPTASAAALANGGYIQVNGFYWLD